MSVLARLRKLAPDSENFIRGDLTVALLSSLGAPADLPTLASKVDRLRIPSDMQSGVVIRAVIGKMADEGLVKECWQGDEPWPRYELAQ